TSIVLRLKDDYDGAEPAAGSIAAMNLWRLLPISRAPDARKEKARRTQEALRATWARVPQALPQALCALEYALTERPQIVIAGDSSTAEFRSLWSETQRGYGPRRTVLTLSTEEARASADWIQERAPWLAAMKPTGAALAYVCEHYTCQAPVANPSALRAQLAKLG
ncbi:MAG TPA: thioredoxin domain-containing protein, partial [Opitutaceae bacterium]